MVQAEASGKTCFDIGEAQPIDAERAGWGEYDFPLTNCTLPVGTRRALSARDVRIEHSSTRAIDRSSTRNSRGQLSLCIMHYALKKIIHYY